VRPDGSFDVSLDDAEFSGRIIGSSFETLWLEVGPLQLRCWVRRYGDDVYVNSTLGQTVARELPRFPDRGVAATAAGLTAPVPGRIVAVEVAIGDVVTAGQTLVVMEAMKVEHRITAPAEGKVVELHVVEGDNVDAHQTLVRLEQAT
jgi:propionyl-CoA carboxylase alpha chain